MFRTLSLLSVVALGAAPAPSVHVVSLPRQVVKETPWHAVLSIKPPRRATLRATGPDTVSARLKPTKRRGRYRATLEFPFAGDWRITVTAGKRTVRLGIVSVDVPKDPLVRDPLSIAAEPGGSLVVGQLREGGLLRIAHAKATKLADSPPGVFH